MLTLVDDISVNSDKLKITHFNIPDAELMLYEPITVPGKTHPTPRFIALFGRMGINCLPEHVHNHSL